MTTFSLRKPRLPSHYYVRFEPPDSSGDEVLYFTSERRKIKLKGRLFREFFQAVIPLLDGQHTVEELQVTLADLFTPDSLLQGLQLLAEHNLLEDGDNDSLAVELQERLTPQLNFFHELNLDPATTQQRLLQATVAVVGLGGAGATAALALAAAHVGTIRCIDNAQVGVTDPCLAPLFLPADVGHLRSEVLRRKMSDLTSTVTTVSYNDPLESDEAVLQAIQGAQFVICCLDQGQVSQIYKLNRACLRAGIPWVSGTVSALEGIVGPTVSPYETACYLCYKMRAVACADNPEDEFEFQRFLDRHKRDDSGQHENLGVGAGIVGNMLALEAIKVLTGALEPSLFGRLTIIDFLHLSMKKHVVLRKPWCPACGVPNPSGEA